MQIPIESLEPETLRRVIEEFVTREGTEYGLNEGQLTTKVDQVIRQLKKGEAILVFDQESESCHILSKSQYADYFKHQEKEKQKPTLHLGD